MYQITIWKKEKRYYGEVADLNLLASDTDPAALVLSLEEEINQLEKKYKEAKRKLPKPLEDQKTVHKLKMPFMFFAAKTTLVAIAASIVIVFSLNTVAHQIRYGFFGGALGPFHLIEKVGMKLQSMPIQTKERVLNDLDLLAEELEPYVIRIRPLIRASISNAD